MKELIMNQGHRYVFDKEKWFVKIGDVVAVCYQNTYECGIVTDVKYCCCSIDNAFTVYFSGFQLQFSNQFYNVFTDFEYKGGETFSHILKMNMTKEQFLEFQSMWKQKITQYNSLFTEVQKMHRQLQDTYDDWKENNILETRTHIFPNGKDSVIYKSKENE